MKELSAISTSPPDQDTLPKHRMAKAPSLVGLRPRWRHVMATIDESDLSEQAISHGIAVANALGAKLTIAHVVEPRQRRESLTDPVEWHLRRQRARSRVEGFALQRADEVKHIETRIEEGRPGEQICRLAREIHADLTIMCMRGDGGSSDAGMGQTAQTVIDRAPGSVLLIPASDKGDRHVRYRRVVVPLDGSSRAESALPLALRLTKAESAELLLIHAVPKPELTEIGPPEPEDGELRARVQNRNERVAQAYLGCVSARMSCKAPSIRTLLLRNGDSRHLLAHAIEDANADLIVMASHGHGAHTDVALGSVASHLLTHTTAPILLVRNRSRQLRVRDASHRPAYLTNSPFALPRAV